MDAPSRARPGFGQPVVPSPPVAASPVNEPVTIFDFVVSDPDFSSLLTEAVVRAGLVDALGSENPLTLFAPNNDAFAAVPADTLNQLLFDDNFLPQLVELLLYHVTADQLLLGDLERIVQAFPGAPLLADSGVTALNRELIVVDFPPLSLNGGNVVNGDNIVSNGVVHIIDRVLLPSSVFLSLADRIAGLSFLAERDLMTLSSLLVLAGIDLSRPAALTVLGPTDDAFGLLPLTFFNSCRLPRACLN
jgi:uncharacterized surface protein with fasciclin (FAS1) repeats